VKERNIPLVSVRELVVVNPTVKVVLAPVMFESLVIVTPVSGPA